VLGLSLYFFRTAARCGGVIRFSPPPSLFLPFFVLRRLARLPKVKIILAPCAMTLDGLAPRFSKSRVILAGLAFVEPPIQSFL
jgi:hypothetical protein